MMKARTPTAAVLAMAAALLATGALADPLADIEAANERLVRDFFAAASADAGFYRAFLAEDVTFQYENNRVEGLDAFVARAAPKLASVSGYAIEPLRFAVAGNTVMNERVDIAALEDGQEIRLNVASVFLIADGKIAEWREYPLPDGGQATEADVGKTLEEIEAANEQLVRNFFASAAGVDLDNPDPAFLYEHLTEDFAYQYEALRIEGLETFIAGQGPAMASVASYSIDVRRVFVIGNTVLNERVDIGTLKDGSERRFDVSSVMRIVDGKIAEWRDYPLPGAAPSP